MKRPKMTAEEVRAACERGVRDFHKVDLRDANLIGVNLIRANLKSANLTGANLTGANLARADLIGAKLTGANLARADLTSANLSSANLSGVDLCGVDLTAAYLAYANLSNANLIGAILNGAYLAGANLTGANLDGQDLSRAILGYSVDLLTAQWRNLTFDGVMYLRSQVESGRQVLPIGGANRLRFIFESHERLTGDELAAARDLAGAFGSVARGARLAFELSTTGERLVVESVGNRETAAQVGLAFLRGIRSAQTDLRPVLQQGDEIQGQIDQVTTVVAREVSAAHREREQLRSLLVSLLEKFDPVEVRNADEQAAAAFEKFAADVGYQPGDLTLDGKVLRFKRALKRAAPATIALIAGAIAQAQGVPGGFDAGTAVAAVGTALLAGGSTDDKRDERPEEVA